MQLGSLFSGIGGLDLGFEQAGIATKWQVEINPIHRIVLADRFPTAVQHGDISAVSPESLGYVDIIGGGFPCQDISIMGASGSGRKGLAGERSGLFWQALRLVKEIRPQWVVFENVTGLLSINDGKDMQTVVTALAECGYLGCWRVLNAQYFGVPQNRRRVFMVAGLGRHPHHDFLADAGPVESLPIAFAQEQVARLADSHAANTLTARNSSSRINLGSEVFVAEENGWYQMAERARESELHGIRKGLDDANCYQSYAAGNAIVPAVARWIAEIILKS